MNDKMMTAEEWAETASHGARVVLNILGGVEPSGSIRIQAGDLASLISENYHYRRQVTELQARCSDLHQRNVTRFGVCDGAVVPPELSWDERYIERLARAAREEWVRDAEPSPLPPPPWEDLSESMRALYRRVIAAVLTEAAKLPTKVVEHR